MRNFLLFRAPVIASFALGFTFLAALGACSDSTETSTDAGTDTDATAVDAGGDADAADAPAPEPLPFVAANLPADKTYLAGGELVFNSDNCAGTTATIDTVSGKISCATPGGEPAFEQIKETDATFGELPLGVYVTRRLVIEPDMVVNVIGNRPLVIVALESATIQGTLRASVGALAKAANGGGFDGAEHADGAGPGGGAVATETAGGVGGAYCGAGGLGGGATTASTPYGSDTLVPLLGGSAGGGGATREGGGGGGAIQIVAGESITVDALGVIDVAGGGGSVTGGGGGAGGAILLQSKTVSVLGTLAANGGGGGESFIDNSGANGTPDANPAKGGASTAGAAGGDGAAGEVVDGLAGAVSPDTNAGKASGGGGGAGRIRIDTVSGAATIGADATLSPSIKTTCATQGKVTPTE